LDPKLKSKITRLSSQVWRKGGVTRKNSRGIWGGRGWWVLLLVMGKVSRSHKTGVGTLGLFLLALLSLLLLVFVLLGFVAAPPSPDTQFAHGAKVELKLPSQLHM
jgi:hypothetical protein